MAPIHIFFIIILFQDGGDYNKKGIAQWNEPSSLQGPMPQAEVFSRMAPSKIIFSILNVL